MDHNEHHQNVQAYIAEQRKAGLTDEQITMHFLQTGWSLEQVNTALNAGVPTPEAPVTNNLGAQTSNAGTPLQVENVQYNMKMKPVQSKVGLYIRVAGTALWFTTIFVCSFLATLINKLAGNDEDLGSALVLTLSLAIVTIPVSLIAYRKFRAEQLRNPASNDDIFFKQAVRKGLWGAIVLGSIAAVVTLYQFMATAFLKNSGGSYHGALSALVFTAGFAGLTYFYWGLHSKTQR